MTDWPLALGLGLLAGGLGIAALRLPLLAWVALAPLGLAMARHSPGMAALAGGVAGAVLAVPSFPTKTLRRLLVLGAGISFVSHAGVAAAIAALWPDGERAWAVVAVPLFAVMATLPLRFAGAPRTATNPLARTQECWLPVVHIARLGSDLWVTAALGTSAGIATLWAFGGPGERSSFVALAAGGLVLGAALAFGALSYRAAKRRVSVRRRVPVAAVVCDGAAPDGPLDGLWPLRSAEYADVQATVARYERHVATAAAAGARVIVLPEVAVRVGPASREAWIDAVRVWATRHGVAIVAPYFDDSRPLNELVVVGPTGPLARYEKQHPGPIEPKRVTRMPPGLAEIAGPETLSLSAVICVDLDYGDLVRPVARARGLLAVPANDWPGYETLHHRAAVWAAVMSGTSVLRATGHGISAAYDPAGRLLAQQTSLSAERSVVLVAAVPV
jgi:apolipoprotein N-acyltransferase